MSAHRLMPLFFALMLSAGCKDDVTDTYLQQYESQYALLCVPGVRTDDGRVGIMAFCQYGGGGLRERCPSSESVLAGAASVAVRQTELRYSAYVDSWDRCWELADACIVRRDCPEGLLLGPTELRVGRDGVIFQ